MKNYIKEYYKEIQKGNIVVGQYIKLLYERLNEGLENKDFFYKEAKAKAVIEWIEGHCFHTEGPLASLPFKLELWQKAFLSVLYGICDKDGKRQFREAVLIVARKNGKTLLAAAIAKYEWFMGNEYGSRVYCTAPKLDQADLVYNSVWQMTMLDPEWQKLKKDVAAGIKYHERKTVDDSELAKHRQSDLYITSKNSVVKKVAFSERKSDGFNPSLVICDEIAAWEGDRGLKQYEVWKSACGARDMGDNPTILLSCSTAGYINDSIYDELIKRSTRYLKGDSKETKLLPFLYIVDDPDKWDDIEELKKSNPNLGTSVSEDYLKEEIAIAEGSLSKKAEFLCKYCNVKQNSSQAWFNAVDVGKQFGEPLNLEDFRGCYAVGGIDLSQTTDLTACVLLVQKEGKIYCFSQFFMPTERIAENSARDGISYGIYEQRGFLKASGENYVDYHDCYQWFVDLIEKYEIYVLKVGYDRYSAQYLVQDMSAYGFNMDDVFQGENLTPVINETDGLMKDGTFNFGDNDLMKLHLLDSALKANNETNRKRLVKMGQNRHIDGCAAFLDAMCVRQKYWDECGVQWTNER